MHRRTEYQVVAVLQDGGAKRLTFTARGSFWPSGKDLILERVPVS
ncbi:hypothetical protein ACWEQL_27145 [Kitasatospora sp. NPDC004240]